MDDRDVARFWDQNACAWVEGVRKGWDRYRRLFHDPAFFSLLGSVDGLKVLDAGCGEGVTCRKLARLGARVSGVDISAKQVHAARSEEKANPLGIDYQVRSFATLKPFKNEEFDRVISVMSLMDSPNLPETLTVICRVLKPGGEVVVSVSHPFCDRPGLEWLNDAEGKPTALVAKNYFSKEPWVDDWAFSRPADDGPARPMKIPTFPRTVSDHVNGLLGAGFELLGLREPVPSDEACEAHPALCRWKHMPFYLMLRGRKKN